MAARSSLPLGHPPYRDILVHDDRGVVTLYCDGVVKWVPMSTNAMHFQRMGTWYKPYTFNRICDWGYKGRPLF